MTDAVRTKSPPESATSPNCEDSPPVDPPKKAKRTDLTQNACQRCRKKKSKCDGKRPTCGRCGKNDTECVYDIAQEGITRMQNLQQMLDASKGENEGLMSLIEAFKTDTDARAAGLLARLRFGENLQQLIASVGGSQAPTMRFVSTLCGAAVFSTASLQVAFLAEEPNRLITTRFADGPDGSQDLPSISEADGAANAIGGRDPWVTWSSRCETNTTLLPLPSESSHGSVDASDNLSMDGYQSGAQLDHHMRARNDDGYRHPDGFYHQEPAPYYGEMQWQPHYVEGNLDGAHAGPSVPQFYRHQEQPAGRSSDRRLSAGTPRQQTQQSIRGSRRSSQPWSGPYERHPTS